MLQEPQAQAQQLVRSCPMCRRPLAQIMRYGRPLNHMKVQNADMNFFLYSTQQLLEAGELYNAASKAAHGSAGIVRALYIMMMLPAATLSCPCCTRCQHVFQIHLLHAHFCVIVQRSSATTHSLSARYQCASTCGASFICRRFCNAHRQAASQDPSGSHGPWLQACHTLS